MNSFQLISGRRISIEHLLLTSSSAILFGFGSGLDIIKYQHSSKPDALAVIHLDMRKKVFFSLYIIILSRNISFAQQATNLDQHINIMAKMSKFSTDQLYSFNLDIYRNANSIKVVYYVLDSLTAKAMFQTVLAYADTASNPVFFLNIDSIAIINHLYKKDSVQFKISSNTECASLIDSSFLLNAHQFDNRLPPDIIHTGGVFYRFTFENDEKIIKVFGAVSPTNRDYPFLARLIKETFSLYKPNDSSLLNKANTNGWYYR